MSITYNELAEAIAKMSDDQKAAEVQIYDCESGEYCPAGNLFAYGASLHGEDDVLDDGHPYITAFADNDDI